MDSSAIQPYMSGFVCSVLYNLTELDIHSSPIQPSELFLCYRVYNLTGMDMDSSAIQPYIVGFVCSVFYNLT